MTLKAKTPNELTILIFKDQLASRTFRVPLRWISRLGLGLTFAGIATLVAVVLSVQSYQELSRMDPTHVKQLERDLSEMEIAYHALKGKSGLVDENKDIARDGDKATNGRSEGSELVGPLPYRFLPSQVENLPAGIDPRIRLPKISVTYRKNAIYVDSAIEYVANDQGNQRGRILILARGPSHLMGYPRGILSQDNPAHILQVNKGESFSVSRYRAIKAEFKPIAHSKIIDSVQILLFNTRDQLLLSQTASVQALDQSGADAQNEQPAPPPVEDEGSNPEGGLDGSH